MIGLFVTTNGWDPSRLADARLCSKVAVQDSLPGAAELLGQLHGFTRTSVWTASPDDSTRLLGFHAEEIILQGEDGQADAVVLNVIALRSSGYAGLISVVTNLWPSRNLSWFDRFLHKQGVRLLPECYLPDNPDATPAAMLAECHRRGYPGAQPVLGLYRGFDLDRYPDRGPSFWVWDAAQSPVSAWTS